MPKKTKEKNNKGSKNKTTKVTQPKKVETKTSKKGNNAKVVETKKVEVKEKPVVKKKKEEGKCKILVNKVLSNTPFVIALCIILLLIGTLLFTLSVRKIPKTSNNEEIIATVNGKKITVDELYESLKEAYGTDALISLIDNYIADKEVTVTDEDKEYVKEVVNYYKDYAEYYGTDLETFLTNYVGLTGITTEEEFSDYVLQDYKKTLAVQKFIGDNADEKDLQEYYKENYSDKITAKHILIEVDSEAEDKDAADKEAYDKAVKLIKKLKEADKDELTKLFDELAEKNSDDTATYSNGGLIEDFSKTDVESSFYEAAYKLKDGEYTAEPVKTSYGYHIILKVSSTPVEKFEDIKDEVKKSYAESLLSSDSTIQISKWDELRKQYKLSIEDDFIKDVYEKTIKKATSKDTD